VVILCPQCVRAVTLGISDVTATCYLVNSDRVLGARIPLNAERPERSRQRPVGKSRTRIVPAEPNPTPGTPTMTTQTLTA
jgi:hypothetical protein